MAVPITNPLLMFFSMLGFGAVGQPAQMNEAAAKEAVHRIVRQSGLLPNFTVREDEQVPTAIAYIKGRERIIAYNPAFISSILDSSHTDWAAVSILAHEIAHHLLGHTLDPEALHPGDELACDRYSGFILQRLGVPLEESLAAIAVAGNVHGTRNHPPKHARSAAIQQGWEEALGMTQHTDMQPYAVERAFQFVVRFAGDENTYYVDADNHLVWFNDHAEPIGFGRCTWLDAGEYVYELTWEELSFVVDRNNVIWRRTVHGMPMQVGHFEVYAREH
ncbi:MAG: hypothetical protein WAU70_03570 [Flavobacteriales bacterium]